MDKFEFEVDGLDIDVEIDKKTKEILAKAARQTEMEDELREAIANLAWDGSQEELDCKVGESNYDITDYLRGHRSPADRVEDGYKKAVAARIASYDWKRALAKAYKSAVS